MLNNWCSRLPLHPTAILNDYASIARPSLALLKATSNAAYPRDPKVFVETMGHNQPDPNVAYFFVAGETPNLITRDKNANDTATTANNSSSSATGRKI